ncbi:hypothetical protein EVAR_40616_1 [Eumeta japonica]|uniref:Uncharacterized protein n=1 Tax=Eumeta variegata TaxID=151549 RepID=A0A4C1XIY8_EUMVA|nr:hypothetical protein EVAR_40616_1 [Eumeta japonica]
MTRDETDNGLAEYQIPDIWQATRPECRISDYRIFRPLEQIQKRAISLYVAEHDTLSNLTIQQWGPMEQCINLLRNNENYSSDLSCMSETIPHISALKKYLDKTETAQRTPNLTRVRASLKTEMESLFKSLA